MRIGLHRNWPAGKLKREKKQTEEEMRESFCISKRSRFMCTYCVGTWEVCARCEEFTHCVFKRFLDVCTRWEVCVYSGDRLEYLVARS